MATIQFAYCLIIVLNAQVSDTTGDAISIIAGIIKTHHFIFLHIKISAAALLIVSQISLSI